MGESENESDDEEEESDDDDDDDEDDSVCYDSINADETVEKFIRTFHNGDSSHAGVVY
jgi:hypothetical protein